MRLRWGSRLGFACVGLQAVSPELGTAGDKELLTVEFLPPEERKAEAVSNRSVERPPPGLPVQGALVCACLQLLLRSLLQGRSRQAF